MAGAPPIVLLHGFTQTGVSWRPVIDALPTDRSVLAPDLPGHGAATDLHLDLAASGHRIAGLIDERFAAPAVVVGYSMGARTALRLALDHPEVVAELVLVGATAGIDHPSERAARRASDEALARRIETEGVAAFLDEWLAQPLFAGLTPAPDDLAARRANTAAGLASSLRLAGTGTMDPPWWDEVSTITCPVVVAWGARDAKFAALGSRLAEAVGANATTAAVADAGHAAHLERPDAVAALITHG